MLSIFTRRRFMCGTPLVQNSKCVALGSNGVGKTSLLMAQTMGLFPNDFTPHWRVLNNSICNISVNGKQVPLELWDTFDNNFRRCIRLNPDADVIILCFSLVSPISYEDVYRKWYPVVREYCPRSPIILVGTKRDLRSNPEVVESLKKKNSAPITTADGLALANLIGSWKYIESSAMDVKEVERVFIEAAHAAGL